MNRSTLLDKLRIGPWLVGAIITSIVVGILYPHQLGVLLWSLTKLCWGAYLGYWIDRSMFPYARPGAWVDSDADRPLLPQFMLRRVIIIAAAILALGLGV
ncbi:putative holin [Halomonas sp. PAMB 3232]|uniref:putative holin n=1 Tax=Halomonas sp. PAMB 3232 TaxID=3075221 RepID=UPI002896B70F|nr:putative holin [Halomonas sp. PAMB 3232]WNL39842.1 putative holin [Halomonas sp. PAMB 3232]